jgi:hypothetical protein
MFSEYDIRQFPLVYIANRCQLETKKFLRGQPSDSRYGYELWRRALQERDEQAWSNVYSQYERLVIRYILRHPSFGYCYEQAEAFVPEVFVNMWRAIPPQRFSQFATLAALLKYLQVCTHRLITNKCPARASVLREEAESRIDPHKFWLCAEKWVEKQKRATPEARQKRLIVIRERFRDGREPAQIALRHPELFADKEEVFAVTKYLWKRLKGHPDEQLKNCLQDFLD